MIQAIFLVLLALLGSCSLSIARDSLPDDDNTITWMHADFPPLRIMDGPFAGQGPSDMIHALMRQELPDYRHRTVVANVARLLDEIKNGKHTLVVGLIPNPERDRVALFSLPCSLSPPIALIVRREDAGHWPAAVSLQEFLANSRLGIAKSRVYGPAVDAVLHDFRDHDNLFVDTSDRLFENLLKMLALKRIDGILGYPFEAMYNARMNGTAGQIAVLPIAESRQYLIGRIAAPRTDWGAAMIFRINKILLRQRPEPSYREAFARWLPPEAQAEFDRVYASRFLGEK